MKKLIAKQTDENNGSAIELTPILAAPYGSSVTLKDAIPTVNEGIKRPVHNKTYLQSVAKTKGAGGEVVVRKYHESLFLEANAELHSRCLHLERQAAAELSGIARQIGEISKIHARTAPYHEDEGNGNIQWTTFDKWEVALLIIFSVLILLAGTNTIAQVLHASGIAGFESWLRCYLFSFTPVGVAFLFKSVYKVFQKPRARTIYMMVIWIGGLLCSTVWVFLFAQTFQAFTQSIGDMINSLSVTSSTPGSEGHSGIAFIFFSIFSEALLAAGAWITLERIFDRRRPAQRVTNAAHQKTQADLNHWIKRKYEQEEMRAAIQGKIGGIEDAKRLFADEAVSFFHLALASATKDRELQTLFES